MRSILRKLCILLISFLFVGNLYASEEEKEEEALEKEIGYIELKPSIVSNLTGGPKYIRADVQLKTDYASVIPDVELHTPAIRHAILMLIASEDGKKLKSRDGKEKLRTDALDAVRKILEELTGKKTLVSDLYFTAYYVK